MTEKRFTVHIRWYNYEKTEGEIELKDNGQPLLISESVEDVRYLKEMLNELNDENEQLKQYISKIDFAIIRKYDNSLENLLDEIYDGEYENWIKKQVSRAKKLDGDVE